MEKIYLYGNWKMYKGIEQSENFINDLSKYMENHLWLRQMLKNDRLEIGLFPSFTSLASARKVLTSKGLDKMNVHIGSQNCHYEETGAFTGEISWSMLNEIDCNYSLIGHSERRHIFGESDELISLKVRSALDHGIIPVLCCGETLEERENGETERVVARQISTALKDLNNNMTIVGNIIYAYEPVWAIGTGRSAMPEDAQDVCRYTRKCISSVLGEKHSGNAKILYGGSVKSSNAESLLNQSDIDGVLVGGASLQVDSFLDIVKPFA